MKMESPADAGHELIVDLVSIQVRSMEQGWTFTPTGQKLPSIDGYIQIPFPSEGTNMRLGVQVKTGKSYICGEHANRYDIKVNTDDLLDWALSPMPVILVWTETPSEGATLYWAYARNCKARSYPKHGVLAFYRRSVFDRSAEEDLLRLARDEAGFTLNPELKESVLFPTKVTDIRNEARKHYDGWRRTGLSSPIFKNVQITLKAWRHITRRSLSQHDIIHRLALMPNVRELIETATYSRKIRSLERGYELHEIKATKRDKFQADIDVVAIVHTNSSGKEPTLYSFYEKRRRQPMHFF